MGLYSGGLVIGRSFASEIWGGLYLGGLIIGRIFASEIWGAYFGRAYLGGGGGLIIGILRYVPCFINWFAGLLLGGSGGEGGPAAHFLINSGCVFRPNYAIFATSYQTWSFKIVLLAEIAKKKLYTIFQTSGQNIFNSTPKLYTFVASRPLSSKMKVNNCFKVDTTHTKRLVPGTTSPTFPVMARQ